MSFNPNFPTADEMAYAEDMHDQLNALNDRDNALAAQIAGIPAGPPGIQGPPGNDGAPGATGPAGADGRSFNLTGEWDGMATYNRLDLVTYSGLIYLCNTDATSGGTPGMDARWTQVQVTAGGNPLPYNGDAEITGNIKAGGNGYVQGELGFGMTNIGTSAESGFKIVPVNNGDGPFPRFIGRNSGMDQSNFGIDGAGITGNGGVPSVQHGAVLIYDGMIAAYKPWNVTVETISYTDSNGNPASKQVLVPPP